MELSETDISIVISEREREAILCGLMYCRADNAKRDLYVFLNTPDEAVKFYRSYKIELKFKQWEKIILSSLSKALGYIKTASKLRHKIERYLDAYRKFYDVD